ncbi:3'-5' exonuclease [Liquorilactobacillus mali]|uniref:DNA polymerase III polC-type n=1 Tax=Liquorilactobacillus mali TaxID=1618 RepID=A0A0R2FIU2_9LACO|nr:3'-5' exonuclease [Liquorilactobacillus mali]KRN28520.1 DNA-directed DNA polymerase III subunit epsilon [Liquorilactobacillus mali]MDN7146167.1 3'-5' exonuclease [Liquorilactobacillus mali]
MNFVAFDFETANAKRNSACSVALTVVENNQVIDELYSLINPQASFYWRNTQIHGIREKDVLDAPTFAELWPHISNFFTKDRLIVAHNANFDCSVLSHTLQLDNLTVPNYLVLDTLTTSRNLLDLDNYKLNTICSNLDITLKHHHNALDDSRACADILLYQIRNYGIDKISNYIKLK